MRNLPKAKSSYAIVFSVLLLLTFLVLSAVPTAAQETTGTLRGTVVDATGAVVPNASVTVTNDATGASQTKQSSGDGAFEFNKLDPGSYTLTVSATGFKRSLNKSVSVKLGIVNPIDVKLEAGNVAETVTVTASNEEIIQRDQSQISTTIEARKIQDLPSNAAGSGLDTLALLAPGVIANNSGGVNTNGTGLSVNGNRARSNNFQIDGSDNNDLSVSGPALFVDNQDALQEYQIITNNFSAQYGRNQGAIINQVTKGGTNDFHGSLFEYHRDNKVLNSLNNIEKGVQGLTEPTPSLFNVFGGQVGGPVILPRFGEGDKGIWKGTNKAFFHFDYQGIRNPATTTVSSNTLSILPSEFPRLLATFPGNALMQTITQFSTFAIPGASPRTGLGTGVSSLVNPTAPTGCPKSVPVGSPIPGGCGAYTGPFLVGGPFDVVTLGGNNFQAARAERNISDPFTENFWDLRFDVRPNQRDSITVRYLHQRQVFTNAIGAFFLPDPVNGYNGDLPATSKNFGGNWTRNLSTSMVNEFRATYQRIAVEFGGGCNAVKPGCIPDSLAIGQTLTNVSFPNVGLNNNRALTQIGPSSGFPQGRVGKLYQFADNLSWTRGNHSFIFGGEYKHINEVVPFLPSF
ncbi:MAG TPA: carboxypeptidase-like regulatory domain-containing protein, partial [Pyrinomonadaceae bacterium]